jgi:hypothetical protein
MKASRRRAAAFRADGRQRLLAYPVDRGTEPYPEPADYSNGLRTGKIWPA